MRKWGNTDGLVTQEMLTGWLHPELHRLDTTPGLRDMQSTAGKKLLPNRSEYVIIHDFPVHIFLYLYPPEVSWPDVLF